MQTITTKRCAKCKEEFPATTEYFYRDKNMRDGLYSQCKKCKCAATSTRESATRKMKNSCCDRKILWRDLHCEQCQKDTRHIYCRALKNPKLIYACFECGSEQVSASLALI